MKHCPICRTQLVKSPDETPANFRRRVVCRDKKCHAAHKCAQVHRSNARRKQRQDQQDKPRRFKFHGARDNAVLNAFLRGGN